MTDDEESVTKVVNVRFTNELINRMEEAAKKEGFRNRSDFISYSVRKYLDLLSERYKDEARDE